jgi:hypothetical protein
MSTYWREWVSDRALRRLLIIGFVGLAGLVISCMLIAASMRSSTGLLLTAPTYRNTQVVSERMTGGASGMRRTTISATNDPIESVIAEINQQLPGFQQTTIYRNNKAITSAYRNYQCNDTPLTIWYRRYFTNIPTNYCMSVIMYPDNSANSGTIIEIEIVSSQ